jgi:serine phosphatase RsbU (regulator of sigma subunit)
MFQFLAKNLKPLWRPKRYGNQLYDNSTMKVVFLACVIIILAITSTGVVSYQLSKKATVRKLKTKDMVHIVRSMQTLIDGRIRRAQETAEILARDPQIIRWISGGETDDRMRRECLNKITEIAQQYDYNNSFIVSAVTGHYWAEGGRLIDTVSKNDPDDSWFFRVIKSQTPMTVDIDFNRERNDTFVFINALSGPLQQPLAVTGVGMSLKKIAAEFKHYKFGTQSNLWLVDQDGTIQLSEDIGHCGKKIVRYLNVSEWKRICAARNGPSAGISVSDYTGDKGVLMDIAWSPVASTGWTLVFQIPRQESLAVLNSVKYNTIITGGLIILFLVVIFCWISDRVANPYRRALELNRELEEQIRQRTAELSEQNRKIMDSIAYARRIQEAVLPSGSDLAKAFREFCVIWKPRDGVGGDFYWLKNFADGFILAVADCTGHGVPGALMSMAASSLLNQIAVAGLRDNPAAIIKKLNLLFKQLLYQDDQNLTVDDGLDIGICSMSRGKLTFAGARFGLYLQNSSGISYLKGYGKGIGYRRTPSNSEIENIAVNLEEHTRCYLTTDGFIDQNGGVKGHSFGRKRFLAMLESVRNIGLEAQSPVFEGLLADYMGAAPQRDDITMIGFRVDAKHEREAEVAFSC